MKRLLWVVLVLALVVPCYAGKVIDVDKLNSWIQANQRDEGTVTPPPVVFTCPIDGLTFSTQALLDAHTASAHPTPSGMWTTQIAKAYKLNQAIKNPNGTSTSFGFGFREDLVPGAIQCNKGKTYFYLDTAWRSFGTSFQLGWLNFDIMGPSHTTKLILLDSSDNGVVTNTSTQKQTSFMVKKGNRYLVEVSTDVSISLSMYW